jgi:hypothetical protein
MAYTITFGLDHGEVVTVKRETATEALELALALQKSGSTIQYINGPPGPLSAETLDRLAEQEGRLGPSVFLETSPGVQPELGSGRENTRA